MAYQSLYRRYRSQTFAEIKGQSHVTTALRTAVAQGRYSHAYLFSGPRGTGKTSTARVLAKALNCENLTDGEPCGTCQSCLDIQNGTSFDLHELDAASNNKVDDIRDLIGRVNLGSPGRTKVYILDEVHMLTPGAENALLKTLEEPPPHVVFVLATTEPQKVVATIRSRTQHFEFKLLPGDELADHLRWVIQDAGLDVDQAGIDYALRQGGGSARDTLSALDLVAAAGGVPAGSDIGLELALAIGEGDPPATVASVERAIEDGREPRVIAETTLQTLRHAFLAAMGAPLAHLDERARAQAGEIASKLGPATITRSLEMLGQALVEMRQAPDARVPLEVALLRLARRDGLDTVGLLQRIEQLERQIAELASTLPAAGSTRPSAQPAATRPTAPAGSGAPSDLRPTTTSRQSAHDTGDAPPPPPRRQAGRQVSTPPASADIDPVATPTAAPAPTPEPTADNEPAAGNESAQPLDLAELTAALDGGVLESVSQRARSRFAAAKPVAADQHRAIFSVPNAYYVPRCEEVLPEIESAFARRFGRPITISLTVDQDAVQSNPNPSNRPRSTSPAASDPEPDEDIGDISALADAGDVATTGIERLTQAFPGSQVIESFDRSPH